MQCSSRHNTFLTSKQRHAIASTLMGRSSGHITFIQRLVTYLVKYTKQTYHQNTSKLVAFLNSKMHGHVPEPTNQYNMKKKGKRKAQGVTQPQTAAAPRPQEEEVLALPIKSGTGSFSHYGNKI